MSMNSSSSELSGAVVVMSSREVSPNLVEVLLIKGIDTCMRDEIHIARYEDWGWLKMGRVPPTRSLLAGRWLRISPQLLIKQIWIHLGRPSGCLRTFVFTFPSPTKSPVLLRNDV
ncbi:hypothetical protein Adt_23306 [Abeliophyllum distichum]|uniref:Uncharacterized protein n=1 Tax=Abeliophyllum distichum TaxID=126358 RepID=A0ABD1SAS1_9LAMI